MRYIYIILLFLPITLFAQSNENAESVSEWTNVSYVDLNNDVISSSNISMGFIGEFSIFSYNLAYEWGNKFNNGIFISNTPSFQYTKVGYNFGREKELKSGWKRTNNLSLTLSASGYSDALTISPYFNQMWDKGEWRLGWTGYVNDFSYAGFEVDGLYYASAAETQFSLMLIGMKEFPYRKWVVRPELFLLSAIRTHFVHLEETDDMLDIWYWNLFNVNSYYGVSIEYNITDVFAIGTKLRSGWSYDLSDIDLGYTKSSPYILSIGTNYDF